VAQSSTRVSSFMRNIDSSDWLKNPELEVVQTNKGASTGGSSFTLTADEVPATGVADDADGKGKKGGKTGKVMASNGGRQ
jgi:type IV pilus assembly protein PilN